MLLLVEQEQGPQVRQQVSRVWMHRNHAWGQQLVRVQGLVQVPQRVLLP